MTPRTRQILFLIAFLCSSIRVTSYDGVDRNTNEDEGGVKQKKAWGATSSDDENNNGGENIQQQQQQQPNLNPQSTGAFGIGGAHTGTYTKLYEPPQGFRITSRVYTDPEDKLAHFDNDTSLTLPYWECGVSGSTTVPIPLQHGTVRHLLGGSQPNMYSGEEFGPHPQLVIALTPLEVELNSGSKRTFQAGDIILLEDVLSGGHKLKGHDHKDMTVMILTLPRHYHHLGKEKSSLDHLLKKDYKKNPCKTGLEKQEGGNGVANKMGDAIRSLRPQLSEGAIRRTILTSVGLTLSTIAGDFMGKVAPLWLAVLFGGGCFVTGGTVAFVRIGEYGINELEMWRERKQLQINGGDLKKVQQQQQATGEMDNNDDDEEEATERREEEIPQDGVSS
mmetsp:Transcript_27394/g.66508  ORF Transcript_27394/g.66508 Transcript_27394/m.66508 type:complete len:391 (+) Transcript_27394:297-1469(+)|eukprot:CAMPEP_0113632838 /NCGR_PEP_ID=MMETSP0017_2-20120614/17077_1 /TAXON_ID=2856 /ORGANISM="Cylindrotheca closterium" /LENGTH=390 /DNA_ID=CAMNT_0000543427 /DNA_START=160 /DNA_END=1329 /DNA_ORIENTATION=- /assembly_acc=CAM_ASM_000147